MTKTPLYDIEASNPGRGRKVFNIEGPYNETYTRVNPKGEFNNLDREWRKRFLKDMKLSYADQQRWMLYENPDFLKARLNIFRRIWQFPMNCFEKGLRGVGVSPQGANFCRMATATTMKAIVGIWAVSYYLMYHTNDWTRLHGWRISLQKPEIFPGDNTEHLYKREKPDDYYPTSQEFKLSPLYK